MTLSVRIAALSHVGRRRPRNEDAVALDTPHGLLIVADGMGGHPGGDVASRLAVEEAMTVLGSRLATGHGEGSHAEGGDPMVEAVLSADQRIRAEGARHPSLAGMGTTLTALHVDAPRRRWTIGHVGDSRAYRFRDGHLEQLTRDDSWIQVEVESGRLTEREARSHPWASLLLQAVGLEEPPLPAVLEGEALPGDVFLLCSDGLLAHLTCEELATILGRRLPSGLHATAAALVDAANAGGGIDNITVGLLEVAET
jgi:protein phosphatase